MNLGEHSVIFGITGSGKSTLTRKLGGCFERVIIFDRLCEWDSSDGGYCVSSYDDFAQCYRDEHPESRFRIIIQPTPGLSQDDLLQLSEQILALIYQVESYNCLGIAIIFEEVWLYCPINGGSPWFMETLLTGRHHRISILGNSQRPATVSKTLVSQSKHVFIGQFFEARDKEYFEACFGRKDWLKSPQKYSFIWYQADQNEQTPKIITTT